MLQWIDEAWAERAKFIAVLQSECPQRDPTVVGEPDEHAPMVHRVGLTFDQAAAAPLHGIGCGQISL